MLKLIAYVLVVAGFAGSATAQAAEKFTLTGDTLLYDTESDGITDDEITPEDVERFQRILRANPDLKTLELHSRGGDYFAAIGISDIVVDYELDTVVDNICSSSCVIIFLAGIKRSMVRGSKIGFHQNRWSASSVENYYKDNKEFNGWSSPFEFGSWIYKDTQSEVFLKLNYLLERGVSADFAIQSLENQGDGMWYPRRDKLNQAGVLRE
jgi:hypothetical protein